MVNTYEKPSQMNQQIVVGLLAAEAIFMVWTLRNETAHLKDSKEKTLFVVVLYS